MTSLRKCRVISYKQTTYYFLILILVLALVLSYSSLCILISENLFQCFQFPVLLVFLAVCKPTAKLEFLCALHEQQPSVLSSPTGQRTRFRESSLAGACSWRDTCGWSVTRNTRSCDRPPPPKPSRTSCPAPQMCIVEHLWLSAPDFGLGSLPKTW